MKELLLEDANDFLTSREWYSERGIPFRRGYLLVRLILAPSSTMANADLYSTELQAVAKRR